MPSTTATASSGSGRGNGAISVAINGKAAVAEEKATSDAKKGQTQSESEGASERVTGVEMRLVSTTIAIFSVMYVLYTHLVCRSYALDTTALLGGNEYLVSQMLDNLSQAVYSRVERAAIRWGIRELCQGWTGDEVPEMAASGFNQGHLVNYFTKTNRERLPSKNINAQCMIPWFLTDCILNIHMPEA